MRNRINARHLRTCQSAVYFRLVPEVDIPLERWGISRPVCLQSSEQWRVLITAATPAPPCEVDGIERVVYPGGTEPDHQEAPWSADWPRYWLLMSSATHG
jgi:hypothetical protein